MESSLSFKRVVDAGMFNGIVLNSVMHLSHMFYADDVVFMGQWSTKNIDTIIYVLNEYRVVQAANRIGCGVLKAPFAYLGSKVGGNMSRIKSWDEIVDKMAKMGNRCTGFKVGYKLFGKSILQEVKTIEDKRSGVEQDQLTDLTLAWKVFVLVILGSVNSNSIEKAVQSKLTIHAMECEKWIVSLTRLKYNIQERIEYSRLFFAPFVVWLRVSTIVASFWPPSKEEDGYMVVSISSCLSVSLAMAS
ncbi:hypothetical protein Tco_0231440 [Tanacetum coccineum]